MLRNFSWCCILVLVSFTNVIAQADTLWLKEFGGSSFEQANEIIRCSQGGYAMVGTTGSNETGSTDIFITRLDEELNCIWSANFGGSNVEWGVGIVEDFSGNFLVCGYTLSMGAGSYDALVLKVNPNGNFMWQQTYGGADWDFAKKIVAHPQGGFLLCGSTYSQGNGGQDGMMLHIDGQGVLLDEWYVGLSENDGFHDVLALEDGWVTCGFQTEDNVMKAAVWRFDMLGNQQWLRLTEDTSGYDREALAVSRDADFLYLTGPVYADDFTRSFEQEIPLDNSTLYEVLENQSFNFNYLDCVSVNGEIVFAGSRTTTSGELGRVVRKQADLYFTGVFEFTGQHKAKFTSIIWHDDILVLCGAFQPVASQNWQALILKYASHNLHEVTQDPEIIPCFTVDVEEVTKPSVGQQGCIFNATGQCVATDVIWDPAQVNNRLSAGIYFFRCAEGCTAYKFIVP